MNYSKNTTTPIADAARFFHERHGKVRYENPRRWDEGKAGPLNVAKDTSNQNKPIVKRDTRLKMEYL